MSSNRSALGWVCLILFGISCVDQAAAQGVAEKHFAQQQQAMELWVDSARDGAARQQFLASMAGNWHATVMWWPNGSAAPVVYEGTSTKRLVMDGRFLQEQLHCRVSDYAYTAYGLTGFNPGANRYTSLWMDNYHPTWASVADLNSADATLTSLNSYTDPSTNATTTVRMVTRVISKDKHLFECYTTLPDGSEFLLSQITYTRQ